MAKTPVTIKPYVELPKSMDFYHLRREGIRHVQNLSGNIWTDYNEHDPGVTILEQLCYALTELGYKTNFNIEVFLKNSLKYSNHHTFYKADDIFPSFPYTSTDFRKYIIYNVSDVKNVWFTPSTSNLYNVKGLYDVKLQLGEVNLQKTEVIKKEVRRLLNASRNLCEDIEKIEILQANKIRIQTQIEIDPAAMGEEVLARTIFDLQHYINPSVNRYSLQQLLDEGLTYSEIFEGPKPKNGFIKDTDLKPLTTEIYISRLTKIILNVPGVLSVGDIQVFKDDEEVRGEMVVIDENKFPILDMNLLITEEENDPIVIKKSGLIYDIDYSTANHILVTLESNEEGNYESIIDISHEYTTPDIPLSEFEFYQSIQNHFPEIYGIGPLGVSPRSKPSTHGHAKQLKAYLLVFEQLMANHLAQLANVQKLFSLEEDIKVTYFYQVLETVPELASIMKNPDTIERDLEKINHKYENFKERRGRFLDHLLARFNEEFPTKRLIDNYKNILPPEHQEHAINQILKNKITYLRNYVELGRSKGQGDDYTTPENETGLQTRISLLLNIKQPNGKIADLIKNSSVNVFSTTSESEPKDAAIQLDEKEVQYKIMDSQGDSTAQFFSSKQTILEEVLTQGIFKRNYEIYEKDGIYTVLFKSGRNHRLELFKKDSLESAQKNVETIIDYLYKLNEASEGFHIIEHTLLRPLSMISYGLTLLDENNQPILVQYKNQPLANQELIAENIDKIGRKRENYLIEEKDGKFEIILVETIINENGEETTRNIARYHELIDSEINAKVKIVEIIDFLDKNYAEGTDIFTMFQFPVVEQRKYFLEDNFYSFRLSIVLPKWCNRFNNKDFQKLLYQTFMKNIPAHIKVDYHWLDYESLMIFETVYEIWKKEKEKEIPNIERLDTASYIVSHLLKSYTLKEPIIRLNTELERAMDELGVVIEF